jgi:toxin ParE1/3/4
VTRKPVILRALAYGDVDTAIDHYLIGAGEKTALDFIEALERTYRHISRYPASGSPRYAHELNLPELRFWLLRRFPYLVFYIERDDHLDVWRVLHGQRDIPVWMRESV